MDHKETDEGHRDPEMFPSRHLVATKQACQVVELSRFIDCEPCDNHSGAHENHGRISDALCAVVLGLWRQTFAEVEIDERDLHRITETPTLRHQESPFPREDQEEYIGDPIRSEYPHEEEMVTKTFGYVKRGVNCLPEPVREESHKREAAKTYPIDRVGVSVGNVGVVPIDQEATPDHERKDRKVDPMHPPNGQRVLSIQIDSGLASARLA